MKPRQPGIHPQVPMPAEEILDDERMFRQDDGPLTGPVFLSPHR